MRDQKIKNEIFAHEKNLGLPPLQLAEKVTGNRGSSVTTFKNSIISFLRKLGVIILMSLLLAGIYLLIVRIFEEPESQRELTIMGLFNAPNLTLRKSKEEILLAKPSLSNTPYVRKRRYIAARIKSNKKRNIPHLIKSSKDAEVARSTIIHFDKPCDNSNRNEICKDIVTKLNKIGKRDSQPATSISSTNTGQIEMSKINKNSEIRSFIDPLVEIAQFPSDDASLLKKQRVANPPVAYGYSMDPNEQFRPYPHQISPLPTSFDNSCLLARLLRDNPEHIHAIYPQIPPWPPTLEQGNQDPLLHYRDILTPARHTKTHMVFQERTPHQQDVELSFAYFKTSTTETPEEKKAEPRDVPCPAETVPCRDNSDCIPEKNFCDGAVDCADASDEAQCSCVSRIDTFRICDGYFDCPFGEDEVGCYGCPANSFSCEDLDMDQQRSTCFTREQRCNNINECPNLKDEMDCNLLSPQLRDPPMFAVSNTEGFLQRNHEGTWYPVCKNSYMWAHDACHRETGLMMRPPFMQMMPVDPLLKINSYINTNPQGAITFSEVCSNSSAAVYVTCPDLMCGTTVPTSPELFRMSSRSQSRLFGRNKRYLMNGRLVYVPRSMRLRRNLENVTSYIHSQWDRQKSMDVRDRRAEARVVGGKPSKPAAWPWMVAIYRDGKFHCGGVILNEHWIISAAHCVSKFWNHYYEIQIGMLRRFSFSPQEYVLRVSHVIVNQAYNSADMKNDLSLLRVKPSITFSRWVRPICLPSLETAGKDWLWGPPAGTMCTAVGWGATQEHGPDPDHIREVEVPVWSECKHTEDRAGKEICAAPTEGGKDACQGDSGGPLLCRNPTNSQQWYVAGIVSHGDGCARKGEPGVYTRVSMFVQWIKYHVFSRKFPSIRPKQECPGFKCVSGMARCLPIEKKCDKAVDCLGAEDEINCHFPRTSNPYNSEPLFATKKNAINSDELLTTMQQTDSENKESTIKYPKLLTMDTKDQTNEDKIKVGPKRSEFNSMARYKMSNDLTDISITTKRNNVVEAEINQADLEKQESLDSKITETRPRGDIIMHTSEEDRPELKASNLELGFLERNKETDVTDDSQIFTTTAITIHDDDETESTTESLRIISSTTIQTTFNGPLDFNNSADNKLDKTEATKINLSTTSQAKNSSDPKNSTESLEKLLKNSTNIGPLNVESKLLPDEDFTEKPILTPATLIHEHKIPVHFMCTRILQIVPYRFRCDHKADCEDGSDEVQCTCIDYLTTFDKDLICDGTIDCADGQDEQNCFGCPKDKFLCKKSKSCISMQFVCDGQPQCAQGEDELDCYALTNGTNLLLEIDGKPKVNFEGFMTKKHANRWDILCEDDLTIDQQETTASRVCRYLGFSAANRVLVKHINIKDSQVTEIHDADLRVKREHHAHSIISTQFSYRNNNETTRQIIKNPVILKEECVPNVTRTCMALYVFCEKMLFTDFMTFEIDDNMLGRAASTPWPWLAKVFVEGEYKCSGVLIDVSWVLISQSCLWDNLLSHHFISVVLGSNKILRSTHGPYEQILQVDEKKDWYTSKVTLLHLKNPAEYTSVVKPMAVSSFTVDGEKDAVCVAVGQDENNNTVTMFLKETEDRCQHPTRCFVKQNRESLCKEGKATRPWAGIISCHGPDGWHPSASFIAESGECGVSDAIYAMDIGNLRSEIKHFLGSYSTNSTLRQADDSCDGVRCARGLCVTPNNMCNGARDCENGADENDEACEKKRALCEADPHQWRCECSLGELKCKNGRCIPKELFGNGVDDCGDGSDEPQHASCAQYLARTAPMRLCDGVLHCKDKTDEDPMFCKCFSKKSVKCSKTSEYCVAPDMMCDGHIDCIHGEDEQKCLAITAPKEIPYGTGIVIERSYGLWKAKCFPKPQHKRSELETICKTLGFLSGHAKQLTAIGKLKLEEIPKTKLILNSYHELALNNITKFHMRSSDEPLAVPMFVNEADAPCYPLLIECI